MPFLMVSPTRRCMYMVTAWHMHGSILVPFTSMIFRAQYGEKRIGDASDKSLCEMFNTTRPEINYIRFIILHSIISLVLNASHYSAIFQNLEHSSIHIWRYSAVAAGRQSASAIPVNHTTHVSKETLRKKQNARICVTHHQTRIQIIECVIGKIQITQSRHRKQFRRDGLHHIGWKVQCLQSKLIRYVNKQILIHMLAGHIHLPADQIIGKMCLPQSNGSCSRTNTVMWYPNIVRMFFCITCGCDSSRGRISTKENQSKWGWFSV